MARSIQELQALMSDLPDYADQFIQMICRILHDYKHMCNTAYRGDASISFVALHMYIFIPKLMWHIISGRFIIQSYYSVTSFLPHSP